MSSRKKEESKRFKFKSSGEFLLSLHNRGSIESEIIDECPYIKQIFSKLRKSKLVRDEGYLLEITNEAENICDLAKVFRNRELMIREAPKTYSWLIPLLHKSKPYPLHLPKENDLKEVYQVYPNLVIKKLQKSRHNNLRELTAYKKTSTENIENEKYRMTMLGSWSRMLYAALLKIGVKLKPVTTRGTEDIVNSVIDGKVDIGFPVPQFRVDEIKKSNKIYEIPVNLNVQTQVYIPREYTCSTVKGWVAEYSTERYITGLILADTTNKKFELCDSFDEVISMVSEGYGIILPTTSGVILEKMKFWTAYECYIPLRKYYCIINKESVPMSAIEKIEKAVKILEQNVIEKPSAVIDAILASPEHVLKEFKRFNKLVR